MEVICYTAAERASIMDEVAHYVVAKDEVAIGVDGAFDMEKCEAGVRQLLDAADTFPR